ncbi:MAG: hypothetical protein QM719_00195 [Thermomonas sp.]
MLLHRRIAQRFAEHDWFSVLVEFVIVLAGILAALAFDDWRQDREDASRTHEHLAQIANEIRSNLWTIHKIQNIAVVRKRQALEVVIRYLDDPAQASETPEKLLADFAESTITPTPWLHDSQLQALQNSGDLRLLDDPNLAGDLVATYAAERTLFPQIEAYRGAYPARVQELLPASLQAADNPLRHYVSSSTMAKAPVIADPLGATEALAQIRLHRSELLPLARGEAAACTATWYALESMKTEFEDALERLAPWDTSPIDPAAEQAKQAASNHPTP